jgi:L-serine dehydratase
VIDQALSLCLRVATAAAEDPSSHTVGPMRAVYQFVELLGSDAPLDTVIETMRQTGEDMRRKYKETSLGGLVVNVVEC